MQSLAASLIAETHREVVACWQLGPQLTGGRWYEIYRAAPKSVSIENGFGYVIKMINPKLTGSNLALAIDRLSREAIATEQILHPNVIRLLDAELDRAPFFLVQPWIEGRSFDRFLSNSSQVSLSRMLWAMRQVAEGITAAHENNRVHMGIEPAHIILGKTGRATLLGWSQSHVCGQKTMLPHDQMQLARYTAPECFEADYIADKASDVYSLGALLYQSLTQKYPFVGSTIAEITSSHRHQIPADLQFIQPLCPPVLSSLIKEMLFKNPRNRPTSRQVLNRLIAVEIDHLTDQTMIPL